MRGARAIDDAVERELDERLRAGELRAVEVLVAALVELRRGRGIREVVRVRAERDVVDWMRSAALRDARPRPDRPGAVLAVRREERLQRVAEPDGDALPVRLVRLPQAVLRRAPVVELVEEPVAREIARRGREARRRRRPRGNVEQPAVDD